MLRMFSPTILYRERRAGRSAGHQLQYRAIPCHVQLSTKMLRLFSPIIWFGERKAGRFAGCQHQCLYCIGLKSLLRNQT